MDMVAYLNEILPPNRWDTSESIHTLFQLAIRRQILFKLEQGFVRECHARNLRDVDEVAKLILVLIANYFGKAHEEWTNIHSKTNDIELSNDNRCAVKASGVWAPEFVMGRSVVIGRALINKEIMSTAEWTLKFDGKKQGVMIGLKKQQTRRTLCCNVGFGKGMEYVSDWPQVPKNSCAVFAVDMMKKKMSLKVNDANGTQVILDKINDIILTQDNYQLVIVMTEAGASCEITQFGFTGH
eukprot:252778_1